MKTLFISDLHLHQQRPEGIAAFTRFMDGLPGHAAALYILGDLFEFWIGDDTPLPGYVTVMEAMRRAADRGLPVYFMHGNRDFLIGEDFAAATGCSLLTDPATVEVAQTPVLLMHGDTLCTDDTEYQAFRRQVRDPQWQQKFLAMPPQKRVEMALAYRSESMKRSGEKSTEIMDVAPAAVTAAMEDAGVSYLIHGHTHRPGIHRLDVEGRQAQRIVLGDWYEQGSVLEWTDQGFELKTLPLG
jgi:UDP-2,3-diacylglucosamine hydrolase